MTSIDSSRLAERLKFSFPNATVSIVNSESDGHVLILRRNLSQDRLAVFNSDIVSKLDLECSVTRA